MGAAGEDAFDDTFDAGDALGEVVDTVGEVSNVCSYVGPNGHDDGNDRGTDSKDSDQFGGHVGFLGSREFPRSAPFRRRGSGGSATARAYQIVRARGSEQRRGSPVVGLGGWGRFGGGVGEGALVFALKEALADEDVDEVPGEGFVGVALAADVPVEVETGGVDGFVPAVGFQVLHPAVEAAAAFPGALDGAADTTVAKGQQSLDVAFLGVVPHEVDVAVAGDIETGLLLGSNGVATVLRVPLKRGEGLGDEGGDGDVDLGALAVVAAAEGP